MISRNIAGATKKSTVVAATFISWAVGNAIGSPLFPYPGTLPDYLLKKIGPQVFLERDAPKYFIAFGVHLGCYSAMTACVIFLRFHLIRQNRKKDEILRTQDVDLADPNLVHAFDDQTDGENLNFRYMY